MNIFDYYKGFEGEPKILITFKNKDMQIIALFEIWEGYFDSIINLISPNNKGYWEGVSLQYHLHTGWYDGDCWECENIDLFIQQLNSIDINNLDREEFEILTKLKLTLRDTQSSRGHIFIEYE